MHIYLQQTQIFLFCVPAKIFIYICIYNIFLPISLTLGMYPGGIDEAITYENSQPQT